ncbi:MAG: hypothetical protein ACFE85_08270 [Candidatus Hodarchaeota archaeon]
MNKVNWKYLFIFIALFLILLGSLSFGKFYNVDSKEFEVQKVRTSYTEDYINETIINGDFSPIDPWKSSITGDGRDVNASTSPGQANYDISGEQKQFSDISGTPLSSDWTRVNNPEFPYLPDTSTINSGGCYVSHAWSELADQTPSVHWDRNMTIKEDMSDYIITSASLTAVVNASGNTNLETPGDSMTDFATYDYVKFYVLFSDLIKSKVYEVAYNQTVDIGRDTASNPHLMPDTYMINVSEQDLRFYLSSVLSTDNHNFTVTLGIRIWCEDNRLSDSDTWNYIYIKSCDLTFTYERKINQFSTVSWYQNTEKVFSGDNLQITRGILKFDFKINQLWPTSLSPNSEIRILINNNSLLETVKLSTAGLSFDDAKINGFDVTYLILKDVNISLSLQMFIADEFALTDNLTISITDVSLEISYLLFFADPEDEPWIFSGLFIIALIATATLTGLLIAYIKVWRFPIPIRKVRKYSKTLTSEKAPDVKIFDRERAFNKKFQDELGKTAKYLKGAPIDGKILREKMLGKPEGQASGKIKK